MPKAGNRRQHIVFDNDQRVDVQVAPTAIGLAPIILSAGATPVVVGSGVLLCPGVVLTARHVFKDQLAAIGAGRALLSVGFLSDLDIPGQAPIPDSGVLWFANLPVTHISSNEDHDLALLTTEVPSVEQTGKVIQAARPTLSFAMPNIGQSVAAMGFPQETELADGALTLSQAIVTQGTVSEVHHPIRDRAMLHFPVIQSDYPSPHGLSGGPVFQEDGTVCAIVASAIDTEDRVSWASLLPQALSLSASFDDGTQSLYELVEAGAVPSDGSHRLYPEHAG